VHLKKVFLVVMEHAKIVFLALLSGYLLFLSTVNNFETQTSVTCKTETDTYDNLNLTSFKVKNSTETPSPTITPTPTQTSQQKQPDVFLADQAGLIVTVVGILAVVTVFLVASRLEKND
jgi:hypothetical protein